MTESASPAEERQRVFFAFTHLDRSRDRATGGYGLGLATSGFVLEQHGGTVTAETNRPWAGRASPLSGHCWQKSSPS